VLNRSHRDGRRFLWKTGDPLPAQDDRLHWRSLAQLSEEPFVDLLADTFTDTKDSIFRAEIAEHGLRGAAERNLAEMLELDHEKDWFEIGYDRQDRPVAVSLPARTPSSAVIGPVAAFQCAGYHNFANRKMLSRPL
jgi:hypothetical protein